MKKPYLLLLSLGFILNLAACAPTEGGSLRNATIWGAPATEKILQNVHGIYDHIKSDAKINVTAARGEYESQHIIITAKNKKVSYTLEYTDLIAEDGTIFSKDNLDVFHELYLELTTDYDRTGNPLGRYPDALVPYEGIVKAKENFVNPTNNQGLYFRFNVPLNQKPGTYTGKATLKVDGETQIIPMTLVVDSITVSEVNHTRSTFLTRWFTGRGELDTSTEMLDKYNRFLYEYRLCGSNLINDSSYTKDDIDKYVELAYDHMQNPKCSTVSIPGKQASPYGFDGAVLRNYLTAFVKKSFETGFNMIDKLAFYDHYVDEPQYWGAGGAPACEAIGTRFRSVIGALVKELEGDSSITSPIKVEVIESIKNIPLVVTSPYIEAFAPWVDTWCPTYNGYDSEYQRSFYADQKEKWWYGCIDPRAPYPTYHMEDTLISARLEPWMRAEYDVVGSLFWAVDVYAEYDGSKYIDIEDYYTGSASRFPNVNGDGWLLYPGAKYGVDGPIPSLRIEAIRDGIEENELLLSIKENANRTDAELGGSVNVDIYKTIALIREKIYNGTRVIGDSESFAEARKVLFDLARLNQNTGTAILDFYDDSYGNYVFTVVAPKGVTINANGINLTPVATINDLNQYQVTIKLSEDKNYLNLSATKNGITYNYSQFLGGKTSVNSVEGVSQSDFSKETVNATVSHVDAASVDPTLTGKLLKVDVNASNMNNEQAVRMSGALLNNIDENADKIVFHVYYDGDENLKYVLSAKYVNSPIYFDVVNVNLTKGMNTFEVSFKEKDWSISGYIEYLTIYLGEGTGQPARTFYLSDSIVYHK